MLHKAQNVFDHARVSERKAAVRNGNFAALLFINHWEYTQNTTFAKQFAYPLLEGLNAWWGCFLTKVPKAGGGYTYNDISAKDPGEEHEGQ